MGADGDLRHVVTASPARQMMDNRAAHKVAGIRRFIKAVGARLLYPPPSSPDVNLVEMAIAD